MQEREFALVLFRVMIRARLKDARLEESEPGIGASSASLILRDPEQAVLSCERREADRLPESALTVVMAELSPNHGASREMRRLAEIEDE
jgi:hypothetical protein